MEKFEAALKELINCHFSVPVDKDPKKDPDMIKFREGLIPWIKSCSLNARCNTPDYLIADYLIGCLNCFYETIYERDGYARKQGKE